MLKKICLCISQLNSMFLKTVFYILSKVVTMSWHICHSYFEEYKAKIKTWNAAIWPAEFPQWLAFRNRTFNRLQHSCAMSPCVIRTLNESTNTAWNKRELINLIGITSPLLAKFKGCFVLVEVIQRHKNPPIDRQLMYGFSSARLLTGGHFSCSIFSIPAI